MHTVRRSSRLGAMAVIVAAAMALFGSVPAQASAWYSISGTVYDSQAYYLSSTVRTVNGSVVQVQLSTIPSRHIRWRLYSTNKGTYFAGPVEISNNSTYGIATGLISGTKFQNSYSQGSGSCFLGCGYNFSGREYY